MTILTVSFGREEQIDPTIQQLQKVFPNTKIILGDTSPTNELKHMSTKYGITVLWYDNIRYARSMFIRTIADIPDIEDLLYLDGDVIVGLELPAKIEEAQNVVSNLANQQSYGVSFMPLSKDWKYIDKDLNGYSLMPHASCQCVYASSGIISSIRNNDNGIKLGSSPSTIIRKVSDNKLYVTNRSFVKHIGAGRGNSRAIIFGFRHPTSVLPLNYMKDIGEYYGDDFLTLVDMYYSAHDGMEPLLIMDKPHLPLMALMWSWTQRFVLKTPTPDIYFTSKQNYTRQRRSTLYGKTIFNGDEPNNRYNFIVDVAGIDNKSLKRMTNRDTVIMRTHPINDRNFRLIDKCNEYYIYDRLRGI